MALDYIDSSVYLGAIFEEGQEFWDYLRVVGYKNHNRGVISEFVLGELTNHILNDIETCNPSLQIALIKDAFEIVFDLVVEKEKEEVLEIVPFSNRINMKTIESLEEVDRELSFDDALHLSLAINEECDNFVTKDRGLLDNEILNSFLNKKYGVKIKLPD